jgi:phospholipase/carboxylesterase
MTCALFLTILQLLTPAEIAPLDPQAGDFLDADLSGYLQTAEEAYGEGNYTIAVRYYLAALSRNIDDEISIYNVACCYALMGDAELAALYLQRAVIAGYRDMDFMRSDPDFDGIRDDPYFSGALEHIAEAVGEAPDYTGDRFLAVGEAVFPCLVRLPEDYDPYYKYPLVVGLHGYGDSPGNFIQLWDRFYQPDFIYACPRAPYPFMENNLTGYSWFVPYDDSMDIEAIDRLSSDYVVRVVNDLKDRYSVSDVFLFGFSQGCALTWMTGMYYPDEFRGLVGFAGRLDTTFIDMSEVGDLSGLDAFVASGTMDESVGVETGMEAVEILEELGVETVFRTWEGVHTVSRPVLLEAQEWMETLRSP